MFMMTPPWVTQAASSVWVLSMYSNIFISMAEVRLKNICRSSAPWGTVRLVGSIHWANSGSFTNCCRGLPSNLPKAISRKSCSSICRTPGNRISAVWVARSIGLVNTSGTCG